MKFNWFALFGIMFLCSCCVNPPNTNKTEEATVDFGNLKPTNASSLMADYSYVALESPEGALFGNMNQIEIYNDKIYILDNNKSNALYVFTTDGKYITKLEGVGDGPGEFISPHSFWIDRSGFIFILDRQLNRLLKYQLSDLHFLDNIVLPAPAPLSFASIPNQDLYIYYY
ncbi:MAG: 6-bladed beta-propeller, partial [Bacteroides sp.]